MTTISPLLLLDERDNVLVCRAPVQAGQTLLIDGRPHTAPGDIPVGHKVARHALSAGDRIFKYGAPIGSATGPVSTGEHVHLHNMKSDYIAAHDREEADPQ